MIWPRTEMPIRWPSSTTAHALATSELVRPDICGSGPGVLGLGLGFAIGLGGVGFGGVGFGGVGLGFGGGTAACDTAPVSGETCRGVLRLARSIAFMRAASRFTAEAGNWVLWVGSGCIVIPRTAAPAVAEHSTPNAMRRVNVPRARGDRR